MTVAQTTEEQQAILREEIQEKAQRARELGATEEEIQSLAQGHLDPPREEEGPVDVTTSEGQGNFQPVPLFDEPQGGGPVKVTLADPEPAEDTHRRQSDAVAEAARAAETGGNIEDAFMGVMESGSYDPEDRESQIQKSTEAIVHRAEKKSSASLVLNDEGEEEAPNLEPEKEQISKIARTSNRAMKEARAYMSSLDSFERLSEAEQDDAVFLKYLEHVNAEVSDEIGMNWGTAADVAGFLVPQENLRYAQVAEAMGVEYSAMDYVDYSDFLVNLSGHVRSLEPEDRQKAVETLVESWPEIHGDNRLALSGLLNDLAGDFNVGMRRTESALERLDQAFIMSGIVTGLVKGANALRLGVKAKNVKGSEALVRAGARGELTESNVDRLDAASSLDPSEGLAGGIVKGADNSLAKEIGDRQSELQIYLDEIDTINPFGLQLSSDEQRAARSRAVEEMASRPDLRNVRTEEIDENSFALMFNRSFEEGTDAKPRMVKVNYTKDDLGGFVEKGDTYGMGVTGGRVASPMFRFHKDRMSMVNLPEQGQFVGRRIADLYNSARKAALKPLSRKEADDLDRVLIAGDEWTDEAGGLVGKEFSREELVDQGVNGVRLNDKQFKAYEGIRRLVDHMHSVKSKEISDRWRAGNVKITRWGDEEVPTQVYDTPDSALRGFQTAETRSHWIGVSDGSGSNSVRPVTSPSELDIDHVRRMYDHGYRLTRAREGKLIKKEGTNLEWGWAKASDIYEPRGIVLNKRPGYMPRIRKDAHYFVKEKIDVPIGGRSVEQLKTVRYFDNHTDAAEYAGKMNKTEGETGDRYQVLADREMSSSDFDTEMINIQGGLFTGARASEPIPFGLSATRGEREGSLEGLQRYVNNLARNVPMSVYRESLQQRWINHAKDLGALPQKFNRGFREALDLMNENHESARFLTEAHRQVSSISGIRTHAEMRMLNGQRAIARAFEALPGVGKLLSRSIMSTSADDLAGLARGVTFHLLLGLFSPAQFFVQASGSFVALSTNPVHGARAVGQMFGYAAADLATGNPAQRRAFIKHMRDKGHDMDGYEIWERSGLREAITNTNMDYKSLFSDAPYDAGMLRRLLSHNTLFFKQGELVNARISFATAYNRWRSMNPGRSPTGRDVQQILARTESYRLNMTRPNAAEFQKGLTSIPTQFMQVQTKFFEKLLGRSELTSTEKARLLTGQLALFGAAGVPAVKTMMPYGLEFLNNFLPDENKFSALDSDPALLNSVYNGILGWMIQDVHDVDSVITGRMALGQDFIENIVNFTTSEVSVPETALGPFGSVYDRASHGITRMKTALGTLAHADEVEADDLVVVSKMLARSVGEMPSSTANLYKAYDMTHSKFFRNKNGKPVASWGDLNTQTQIAQALGFSSQDVADWYEINMRHTNAVPRTSKTTEANRIVRLLAEMSDESEERQQRWHALAVNAIMSKYSDQNERAELVDQVGKQLSDPGDAWGRKMKGVLEGWTSELQNGLQEIHNQLTLRTSPALARQLRGREFNTQEVNEEEQ